MLNWPERNLQLTMAVTARPDEMRLAMKGLLFYDYDGGKGGPGGFTLHERTWCVEVVGKKHHVHSSFTGEPGFPSQHNVTVESCDGSCAKLTEIPSSVWEKASPFIHRPTRMKEEYMEGKEAPPKSDPWTLRDHFGVVLMVLMTLFVATASTLDRIYPGPVYR